MPIPPPLNFPAVDRFDPAAPFDRYDRFSANVPAGWVWRPQGDSMPGWGSRERPSRSDRRENMSQGYVDVAGYSSGQVRPAYGPQGPSGFDWRQDPRVPSFHGRGAQPGYSAYNTPGSRASAHSRQRSYGSGMHAGPQQHPSSGTHYTAQPDPRVFYGHTSYNAPPPPRMIQSTEDALRQHNQRSGANTRPNNNISSGPPQSSASHFPAHVRNHPRFAEAEHAAEMVRMFGAQDPRARPYLEILRQISGEMEGSRLW
jgi:hypothetical protein